MTKKMKIPQLSPRQIRELRGLGHHRTVLSMIGKEGITPNLVAHELVKVRIQDTCPLERQEAAAQLATAVGAAVVQILGKTALLYRPNPDLDDARRIVL